MNHSIFRRRSLALNCLLSAVLAAGFAGCDDDDDDPVVDTDAGAGGQGGSAGEGGAGGAGGDGGSAGEGGVGGDAGAAGGGGAVVPTGCRTVDEIDMNAEGSQDGDTFTYEGQTGETDDFAGACSGELAGSEAVVRFTAPSAGYWSFSTEGSSFNTVMYALMDCNDGFSEVACNDDDGEQAHSAITVELEAGAPVFLVVDSFDGVMARDFMLTAEPAQANAPELQSFEGFINVETGGLALRVSGLDAEGDIQSLRLELLDAAGNPADPLPIIEAPIADLPVSDFVVADGAFSFVLNGYLDGDLSAVAQMRLVIIDALNLESAPLTVNVSAPEVMASGEACDPAGNLSACGEGTFCLDGAEGFSCIVSTPPALLSAEGFANLGDGALGVSLSGTDTEDNAAYVQVLPLDEAGEPMMFGEGVPFLPVVMPFDSTVAGEGNFTAIAGIPWAAVCFPTAEGYFNDCGQTQECVDEANEMLAVCNGAEGEPGMLATVTSVRIWALDAAGLNSEPMDAPVGPAPDLVVDDVCDIYLGTGVCPDELVCANYGAGAEPNTCQAPQTICPADWTVVDMNTHEGAHDWTYEGDSAAAVNLGGNGTCGGGGPNPVHSFTATEAGTYTVDIEADGDTLLYARTYCALGQAEFELGCNDDIAEGNLLSHLELALDAGQTAYIFVDGYQGGFAGAYTLIVGAP